jgi:hypothetical protein
MDRFDLHICCKSDSSRTCHESEERASYVVGGSPIVQQLHADAASFNKVLCGLPAHPGHIAVLRLNRARRQYIPAETLLIPRLKDIMGKNTHKKGKEENAAEYGNFKVNITE